MKNTNLFQQVRIKFEQKKVECKKAREAASALKISAKPDQEARRNTRSSFMYIE